MLWSDIVSAANLNVDSKRKTANSKDQDPKEKKLEIIKIGSKDDSESNSASTGTKMSFAGVAIGSKIEMVEPWKPEFMQFSN